MAKHHKYIFSYVCMMCKTFLLSITLHIKECVTHFSQKMFLGTDKLRNNDFVLINRKAGLWNRCNNLLWNTTLKNLGVLLRNVSISPFMRHRPRRQPRKPLILTSWHKLLTPNELTQLHHLRTRSQYTPLPLGRCVAHFSAMNFTYTVYPGSLCLVRCIPLRCSIIMEVPVL
jgi:hypothetical protein